MNTALLAVWIIIGFVHLGLPLVYLAGMKRSSKALNGYHLRLEENYQPTVSILVPTYNEASVIERKIANLETISYPKDKVEVFVVDGGSTDGTSSLARSALTASSMKGIVIQENARKGKALGLNAALEKANGELVCISDAECEWEPDALRNGVRYMSDPSVGSVSGVHRIQNPHDTLSTEVEDSYRSVYRQLRIAESKIQSTPVAEGELQIFRRDQLGGFDPNVGGDDTDAALEMVSKGLRAISAEDVVFHEPTPRSWSGRFRQKIRRGQHVLQAFLKHKNLLFSNDSPFSRSIFPMEFFIYAINPLLFVPFLLLTLWVMVDTPILIVALVGGMGFVISLRGLRQAWITYVTNNLTMLAALLQEARGVKQLQWTKIDETRERTISSTAELSGR